MAASSSSQDRQLSRLSQDVGEQEQGTNGRSTTRTTAYEQRNPSRSLLDEPRRLLPSPLSLDSPVPPQHQTVLSFPPSHSFDSTSLTPSPPSPPQTPSPSTTRRFFTASSHFSPTSFTFPSPETHGGSSSGSGNGWTHIRDPVEALEGRYTPFFMPFEMPCERNEYGNKEEQGEGNTMRNDRQIGLSEQMNGVRTGELNATSRNGSNGREEEEQVEEERGRNRDSGYYETNPARLSLSVLSLTSHVSSLTNHTTSLYTRLRILEETSHVQSAEIDALRAALSSFSFPPRLPPSSDTRPFQPPPLPRDLQDYPSDYGGSDGQLTPPASAFLPPQLHHPHPHHPSSAPSFFLPSPYGFDPSGRTTPRSPVRSRAHSVAGETFFPPQPNQQQHQVEQFNPPYGPHFPPAPPLSHQQQQYGFPPHLRQQSQPPPFLPAFDENGGRTHGEGFRSLQEVWYGFGGQGGGGRGMGRERAMSLASGSTAGSSGGRSTTTLHHRSVSLGSGPPPPRRHSTATAAGSNGMADQLNYRLLLESDAEIDDEAFVQRILVHNDQQCSLFLQQRVRATTPEKRQKLFDAVGKNVLELSYSKFGNFLVSRCLEAGDLTLAQQFESRFSSHFLQLALDPFGCHVVQKLLDCGDSCTKQRIVEELLPHPQTLTQKNSCHVWNRILTTSNPPSFFRRLAEMGKGTWANVVKDEGGSLVVQHMLEDWAEAHTSAVAREILSKVEEVGRNACGSFVIGLFIDRNVLPFCSRVMQVANKLALDNIGAKLVEKCVRSGKASSAAVSGLVASIVESSDSNPPLLLSIAANPSGTQLVAVLLSSPVASYRDKEKLARCMASNAKDLVERTGGAGGTGAKLVAMCQGRKG